MYSFRNESFIMIATRTYLSPSISVIRSPMRLPFGKFIPRPLGNFVVATFVESLYIEPSTCLSFLDVIDCGPPRAMLFTVDTIHHQCGSER